MNRVNDAIEEWKKEHFDKVGYWPDRDKDLYKLAEEMLDFFNGMKRSSKRELKKKDKNKSGELPDDSDNIKNLIRQGR